MLLVILFKLLGTALGIITFYIYSEFPILVSGILGIAPIWLEILITRAISVEPSLESSRHWLLVDAFTDALSFVLVPPVAVSLILFLCYKHNLSLFILLSTYLTLVFFIGSGIFRLQRFLKNRLVNHFYFEGLPVTYTGYIWLLIAVLFHWDLQFFALLILLITSGMMISTKLKIKISRN